MNKRFLSAALFSFLIFSFTGCYSVFSGGTGGLVVDAESTSTPKIGLANVDIYAYTSMSDRDSDFNKWIEGSLFVPQASYYGHTTTGNGGNFTISKIVWKSNNPAFGKDADSTKIYLLYYHENYGLTKGSTVIISDSTTQTVYAELTKVRKETILNLKLQDASGENTSETVYVEVSVPQTTDTLSDVPAKVYKTDITGNGAISISYPRWQNEADKNSNKETEPEITITYRQNADVITWQGCYNEDNSAKDFSFRVNDKNETTVTKKVNGNRYDVTLYGKRTKFYVPSFNGQWGTSNGVTLTLFRSENNGSSYTVDCGSVETEAVTLGTNGTQKNGCFNNLGAGKYWFDYSYTGKTTTAFFKITDGSSDVNKSVTTDRNSVTIQKD